MSLDFKLISDISGPSRNLIYEIKRIAITDLQDAIFRALTDSCQWEDWDFLKQLLQLSELSGRRYLTNWLALLLACYFYRTGMSVIRVCKYIYCSPIIALIY